MSLFKKIVALAILIAMLGLSTQQLAAVAYVTDTGGYAYDESRAVTNLAPAIALGTLATVGIIAIAVQNSHGRSSSSHYGSDSSSYSCSSSSGCSYSSCSSSSCSSSYCSSYPYSSHSFSCH